MDVLAKIKDKERELGDLWKRMDWDRNALYLEKFVLTGFNGGPYENKEIPNTVSITMNRPAVFAQAFTMLLQNSKQQIAIEGLADTKNKHIENYLNDVFYTIDLGLKWRKIPSLKSFICNHVAIRGPIGARYTWDSDGTPNVLPLDMRNVTYDMNRCGVDWFANRTWRTADSIRAEYCDVEGVDNNSIPEQGDRIECIDYWDGKTNEVYIDGVKILELPNIYPSTPAVIDFPSSGFMLMDEGYEKHWCESIFYLIRDMIPEWNRLMSIQMTKAMETVKPRYTYELKPGDQKMAYPEIGANIPHPAGSEPKLLESMDTTNGFEGAKLAFDGAYQTGSLSESELGNVQLDRTAVWINAQTEIRNKMLIPRLECIESFYRQSSEMLIRQYQSLGFVDPKPLGKRSKHKVYVPDSLDNPDNYEINVKFMPDNRQQKLANYSVAIALKGTLSDETIVKDILECDDPKGELDRKSSEEARQASPVLFYRDKAYRLLDISKTLTGEEAKRYRADAHAMADQMVMEIKKATMNMETGASTKQGTADMQTQKGYTNQLAALPQV